MDKSSLSNAGNVVHVCPDRDIECGSNPRTWCNICPKLGAAAPGRSSSRLHELKTDPEVFAAIRAGTKTHTIRLNDRNYAVGDHLLLRETESTGAQMAAGAPLVFTGETERRTISHIQSGYGLADRWCILSFAPAQQVGPGEQAAPASLIAHAIATVARHDRAEAQIIVDRYLASLAEQAKTVCDIADRSGIGSSPN